MGDFEKFMEAVKDYQLNHLNKEKPKFKISEKFDLEKDWKPDVYYPFCDEPGIYAIFSESDKIIYIGKASNNNSIGARLATYFITDEKWKCETISPKILNTKITPKFILAVAVKNSFEAPSLEEYLIKEFDPPANSIGKRS